MQIPPTCQKPYRLLGTRLFQDKSGGFDWIANYGDFLDCKAGVQRRRKTAAAAVGNEGEALSGD